jgi:hypothetical protein
MVQVKAIAYNGEHIMGSLFHPAAVVPKDNRPVATG